MPKPVSRAGIFPFAWMIVVALAGCATGPAPAADPVKSARGGGDDLVGAWSIRLCDRPEPKMVCGTFAIYLVEGDQGLCGEHFVATPGAARLDEGEPGSVLGSATEGGAVVVVRSGRNDARYLARIERRGAELVWRRVGMVVAGINDESPILPEALTLKKDDSQGAQDRLRALQDLGCEWPDWGD